eukprot:422624-Prymnesium_polylepis.2
MQPRAVRREKRLETVGLQALFKSPARPDCSPTAFIIRSAAKPVAGGQPVSIVKNLSGDLLDGGADGRTTSLATPATGPAASTMMSNVQVELRGARSRSSHRRVG